MASRRKGRILAFQALYSWDIQYSIVEGADDNTSKSKDLKKSSLVSELLDLSWAEQSGGKSNEEMITFSRLLITGTVENISEVDRMIKKHLQNWEISRLNRVDLAVLRMSVYTLLFQTSMHPAIVIDEAIGICKEFGSDDSFRFVNGVLDSIRKTIGETGSAP